MEWIFTFFCVLTVCVGEQSYRKSAQEELIANLARRFNNEMAKNVILIVGDGMSLATIAAARIVKGHKQGRNGIGEKMLYETLPNIGLARTYATDKYVPDSASTATALLCGVKTKYEAVGVDETVQHGDCASVRSAEVRCIAEWFLAEGKSTGFVTNMRVTHATLAPLYAHAPDRWWEYDAKIPDKDRILCKDIARQLVEDYPGRKIQVILGGGRESFMPNVTFDPEYPELRGKRTDRRPLVEQWKRHKQLNKLTNKYVWNKHDFDQVDPLKVDYLLGLFERSHMYDVSDRTSDPKPSDFEEPTLAEMTAKAIQILSRNSRGYFLLVEGGLIDKSHHNGKAVRAVLEALDLEESVQVALNLTSVNDTLVIVTSDHSQGMMFAGYANVGESVFGIAEISNSDHMPYTSLLYSTGPGFSPDRISGRKNISGIDTTHKDYVQQAVVPRSSTAHAGEDVAVYASGPMGHLFTGVYDQHYIAHAMAYASCVGSNKEHCKQRLALSDSSSNGRTFSSSPLILLIGLLFVGRDSFS